MVKIEELFENLGVMKANDHFVYTSGKHGAIYFDKERTYLDPNQVSYLCQIMAARIPLGIKADIIAAPEVGAITLLTWLAYHHGTQTSRKVKAAYARKGEEGTFLFKGSYPDELRGKKVWVVEDVINTGVSAKRVINAVRECGGEVLGLSVLCNRGGHTPDSMGVPHLISLLNLPAEAWPAESCPLCKKGKPINLTLGHGAKFVTNKLS